jgi:NAD(P)-dependent dehydrogenase (short-subunit alcohol dehydrogenase family)
MRPFENKVVVITGAASGIGKALALQLAAQGAQVVAADVNEEKLRKTADAIVQRGGRVSWATVDVSDRQAVYAFADQVIQQQQGVHVVINNAGVALSNVDVQNLAYEDLEWVLGTNLWGVIYGTKAFLPHLLKQPQANLVNVSSVFGLAASAKAAAYSTSKFAVRGFSEALRQELRGTSVAVTVVFPGGIRTNIARNTRLARDGEHVADTERAIRQFEAQTQTTSEEAARRIIEGIRRNAPRVLIGNDAKVLDLLARLRPGSYDAFMLKHAVLQYDEAR